MGKGLRGEGGKGSQQGKGATYFWEEKGEDLKRPLKGKGGERISTGKGRKDPGRKREKISGGKGERISTGGKDVGEEKGLGGKGGKGSQQGKRGKHLREEKEEDPLAFKILVAGGKLLAA